jgi:D-alanyl-lipoteichoic acid acyltransferase DltB (MBOAT superfamily)
MLFPTAAFAVFFSLVYPVSWLLRRFPRAWKLFILGASYVFYGFWDPRFVSLIVLSTALNQAAAIGIARRGARGTRIILTGALVCDLTLLAAFKYYGFFIDSLGSTLREIGLPADLPVLTVIAPVGISFFTFQAISYVVDVYRGRLQPAAPLDFAVYLSFFPHLVAGPIVRAAEFLPQLRRPRGLTSEDVTRAAVLFARGLFMKVVISSYVASTIVDPVFGVPSNHSAAEILLAVYGYAVQIYADFSGYTDMAIAVALLLGIRFPQNFDRPYAAASLQDFWRRWHMALSNWLRDYLYIPLGGNRAGRVRTYLNLLITMALGGLWHGAAMTFILWGVFHGLGLGIERRIAGLRWPRTMGGFARGAAGRWLGRLLTFHLVCIGWVLFRADSIETAGTMLKRSVTAWGPAPLATAGLMAVIAGALALQYLPAGWWRRCETAFARAPLIAQGAAIGIFIAFTFTLGPKGVAPFIYYQF